MNPSADPPPPSVFMVEDFERGPGLHEAEPEDCMKPSFEGQKPLNDAGQQACDWMSVNSSSCDVGLFCGGSNYGGICPDYFGREEGAWRGDFSLRLYYNIDDAGNAFSGVFFNVANKTNESGACLVPWVPIDLTNFEYLSLRLRPGDKKGNLEIALHDEDGLETKPKAVLVSLGQTAPEKDKWTEERFQVCDLLKVLTVGGGTTHLKREAISKIYIDFSKDRFIKEGTDQSGTRYLDIDDISFIRCATTGCEPCLY